MQAMANAVVLGCLKLRIVPLSQQVLESQHYEAHEAGRIRFTTRRFCTFNNALHTHMCVCVCK